jgi:hypothetical protein
MHEVRTKESIRLNLSFGHHHVKPGLPVSGKYKQCSFSSTAVSGFFGLMNLPMPTCINLTPSS